jgi:acid phosphatase (class A)
MKLFCRIFALLVCLPVSFSACAGASAPPSTNEGLKDSVSGKVYPLPTFLSKDAIDPATVIPPPPAHASSEDQADLKEILDLQNSRTPKDCVRAATEVHVNLGSFYGKPYGPLTQDQVKKWDPLFKKAQYDTDYLIQEVKVHYARPRPYASDPKINPCIKRETTGAYPSGHAAIARVLERLLEIVDPAQKTEIDAREKQIAHDRVMGGVHHPTDIRAGGELGDHIFDLLMKNPKFAEQLEALKM